MSLLAALVADVAYQAGAATVSAQDVPVHAQQAAAPVQRRAPSSFEGLGLRPKAPPQPGSLRIDPLWSEPESKTAAAARRASTEGVERALRERVAQLDACRVPVHVRDPRLQGSIVLRLRFGPAGTLRSVDVARATLQDAAMQRCMLQVVRNTTLPKAPPSQTLFVPLVITRASA